MKGSLVISLDFALMWGNIELWNPDTYGKSHVKQVPKIIDNLLDLFNKYNIHVTFSTVGLLMHANKDEVIANTPFKIPTYDNKLLSPYENNFLCKINERDNMLYFAPDIIKRIKQAKGMEIGTHTYCHYYCWEKGQTLEQFDYDLDMAFKIAKQFGIRFKSIVFPRNQVSVDHLKICSKYGITSYRGIAKKFFYEPKSKFDVIKNKICRIIDAYINIGGYTTIPFTEINTSENPINLRASRLLRPYNPKLACLDWLRLRRMKKEMIYAAKNNHVYHIWWHPHNFGANIDENFSFLEELLKCYKYCHKIYGMKSYTMSELRDLLVNKMSYKTNI